jgi:hypothetical protein
LSFPASFTYTVALYTTGMVERRDGAAPAASPDDRPVRVRDDNEVTEKAETDVDSARLLSRDGAIFIFRGSSQKNSDGQAGQLYANERGVHRL